MFFKYRKFLLSYDLIYFCKWTHKQYLQNSYQHNGKLNDASVIDSHLDQNLLWFSFWQPGVTTQSTKFNRNTKEGRGDTSAWTDTPSERAQRAKMKYVDYIYSV